LPDFIAAFTKAAGRADNQKYSAREFARQAALLKSVIFEIYL
jgi:hypothetical protein